MSAQWADVIVTLFLGAVGVFLANSYWRQIRMQLAEKRLSAYARLWELMEVSSPMRQGPQGAGSLTPDERRSLYQELTHWYYVNGNGILLEPKTREMYLNAKHNLICEDDELRPQTLAGSERGALSIRQLSLLRSQMRADLSIFVRWYYRGLSATDKEFLRYCGVDLGKKPWKFSTPAIADRPQDVE